MGKRYGIFFDLDGTLIDNEHLKAVAFSQSIDNFGGQSHPSIYEQVMGNSGETISSHFMEKAGIQVDLNEYMDSYRSIYQELIETNLVINPGVIPFLKTLKGKGVKLAVVSSAHSSSVNYVINSLDIGKYFDFVISGDNVIQKKPHPACYLLALKWSALPKEQVIVFEDTESGLEAAQRAGIASLAIRHSYNRSHDFSTAVAEYESFERDRENINKTINSIFDTSLF